MNRAGGPAPAPSARAGALACAIFAALVALSVGALFYAQAAKRQPALIHKPTAYTDRFAPGGNGISLDHDAHFKLETTVRDVVDVDVVTPAGRLVKQLAHHVSMGGWGDIHVLSWDGTNTRGVRVARGDYEIRIHLQRRRQTFVIAGFRLDLEGPAA